jgi:hypothetical protein
VSFLPILTVAGGLALVLVIVIVSYRAEQKRRALLQSFALSNGWTYSARDDTWCERFVGTPFGQGDNRTSANILHGPYQGTEMVAFDYSYETSSTDSKGHTSKTTHRFAVCALRMPAALPGLELGPESALTRFAGHLGLGDVELESEDFNRRYRVKAHDPKFAYDVLNPRTMEALLARPTVHLRLLDVDAVCWDGGRLEPPDLLARLSTLQLVIAGIPSFVWSDHEPSAENVENPQGGAPA